MKDKYIHTITAILVLICFIFIMWGVYIAIKQMDFSNDCESRCLEKDLDYETEFRSYPISNVNGKCFCKSKFEEIIE